MTRRPHACARGFYDEITETSAATMLPAEYLPHCSPCGCFFTNGVALAGWRTAMRRLLVKGG